MNEELLTRANAWLEVDPDPETSAELADLIAGPRDELERRFGPRLEFGTAGLRGALGAGPTRMNRVLVRTAAAGVVEALKASDCLTGPVVIGCDARTNSDVFALDSARVMAARGAKIILLPKELPTPVLAFAVRHFDAAAGVMVTASHNPPADNGYKVYWGDGAQIVEPTDALISANIDSVGLLSDLDLADENDPLIQRVDDEVLAVYLDTIINGSVLGPRPKAKLRIVYTAMHGVGGATMQRLWTQAGFDPLLEVAEQFLPDPAFPTVPFPNPEEPGAMDLSIELAKAQKADLVIANDPDADRLAVAIPLADSPGWRALSGNEIGWLLSNYLLANGSGENRLVATTIVSSTMLSSIADSYNVHSTRTLTGFKWIVRPGLADPSKNFVFGYEEAIGFACNKAVRDKDGVSAALTFAQLTSELLDEGRTIEDALDDLARAHGVHLTDQISLRFDGQGAQTILSNLMERLRSQRPTEVAGEPILDWLDHLEPNDLPATNAVTISTKSLRIVIRPSGTEPKLKIYLEARQAVHSGLVSARKIANEQIQAAGTQMRKIFAS